uniref:Uncharacterized protein n=1 Tax=Tetranychus urticae TaxID=32264 RepID=T1KZM3_TETUR
MLYFNQLHYYPQLNHPWCVCVHSNISFSLLNLPWIDSSVVKGSFKLV